MGFASLSPLTWNQLFDLWHFLCDALSICMFQGQQLLSAHSFGLTEVNLSVPPMKLSSLPKEFYLSQGKTCENKRTKQTLPRPVTKNRGKKVFTFSS